MIERESVVRALDELERIQNDLAKIGERVDDARRHELIQLRRSSAAATAQLIQLAEPFFANVPTDQAEFRRLCSAMRSAVAQHQADWPAVRLNDVDERYAQSAQQLRSANTAFLTWLRSHLKSPNK